MLFASPITSNCLQTFSTKTEFQIEGYTTISNHDNNARTPTHCNNRNLESNDISVQTAPRRHSSYPTSMRSACGIERAGRSFPFDSRARMDKPTQTGITTRLIRCAANGRYRDITLIYDGADTLGPCRRTPDEFPIKARSSSYEQRNPITLFECRSLSPSTISSAEQGEQGEQGEHHEYSARSPGSHFPPHPTAPMCRRSSRTRKPTRHDFAARTVPRFSEGPTRQASLRSIIGCIYRSSYHARGRYGSPRKPIYPIPFFIGRQPKTNICRLYRAVSGEHPANKKDARRTSFLLTLARPLPDPGLSKRLAYVKLKR